EDPNSGPLIGDVVVSEVHYHPSNPPAGATLKENEMEFLELHNRTGTPLNIGEWRLRQSVNFTIPANTIIGAHGTFVVVSFDPVAFPAKTAEFRSFYRVADSVQIFGPYNDDLDPNSDLLDNSGETIIWERPEDILQLGLGYVLVDRVTYRDDSGWPEAADGDGFSLTRNQLEAYGDFASSWSAAPPTPGTIGLPGDANGDGRLDGTDLSLFCTAINLGIGDLKYDVNRDQVVDHQDFRVLVTDLLHTTFGDANLSGTFDSSDLVTVFAAGQYEDAIPGNSTWATGDWNCDAEFNTADLVTAFQEGGYEAAAAARIADLSPPVSSLPSADSVDVVLAGLATGKRERRENHPYIA
ncbi:MAG: lamin tail domain-containing protein, partial [Planctomycetales bacterium]|nr:lamin tail domain-containing protein [Planctomycetales bacterium]